MAVRVVKGMPSVKLDKQEFKRCYLERFYDPAFEGLEPEIERLIDKAWEAYDRYRKSPRTAKAGPEFHNPDFDLPIEWLEARRQIKLAEERHKDPVAPSRILLINGSTRTDQSCPGEMSKTWRLVTIASDLIRARCALSRRGSTADARLR